MKSINARPSSHLQEGEVASSGCGFLDLPNEIMIIIFENLESELYSLALISRRLHYLALPLYLARHGMDISIGELVLFDHNSDALLRGLTIALFSPPLKRFSWAFGFTRIGGDPLKGVRVVIRLISKFSRIDEAVLNFSELGSFSLKMIVDTGETMEMVTALLNAVVLKSCTSLTVCTGDTLAIASQSRDAIIDIDKKPTPPISSSSNIDLGMYKSFRSMVSYIQRTAGVQLAPLITPQVPLRAMVGTFHISASMLFNIHMINWTIQVLNSSSLTTLSFQSLDIDPQRWAAILPSLVLPSLSKLVIDKCIIPFIDLAQFLLRHPQIVHLYLGRYLPSLHDKNRLPKVGLHQLTTLCATPEYLLHLLSPKSAFPSLCFVTVILRVPCGQQFDFSVINKSLALISDRLSRTSLSLKISLESSSAEWMIMDVDGDMKDSRIACLLGVTSLELKMELYRMNPLVMSLLPRWLALFPVLQRVTITSLSRSGPIEPQFKVGFVRSISRACSGIRIIGINDEEHPVSTWFGMKA